jgi:hypothetical protein
MATPARAGRAADPEWLGVAVVLAFIGQKLRVGSVIAASSSRVISPIDNP